MPGAALTRLHAMIFLASVLELVLLAVVTLWTLMERGGFWWPWEYDELGLVLFTALTLIVLVTAGVFVLEVDL